MFFSVTFIAAAVLAPLAAATVLSVGLVAAASVMTRAGNPNPRLDEKRYGHDPNELSGLHDELKLDARQETLWYKAEKGDWEAMGNVRLCFRKQYEEALAMLDQPNAALRPASACVNDAKLKETILQEGNRERWLPVYETLNAGQKERVRLFFQGKLERMGCFGPCSKARV